MGEKENVENEKVETEVIKAAVDVPEGVITLAEKESSDAPEESVEVSEHERRAMSIIGILSTITPEKIKEVEDAIQKAIFHTGEEFSKFLPFFDAIKGVVNLVNLGR